MLVGVVSFGELSEEGSGVSFYWLYEGFKMDRAELSALAYLT